MRIAIIGATGTLGRPVARELIASGHEVTVVARQPEKALGLHARSLLPGDVFELASLRKAFRGQEAVYLNLSVRPTEKKDDRHAETDGLRNVITAAREERVQRIAMISSLVMRYQGMNGFHWWVFDVKKQALDLLKGSGIPSTVFYPSSFMENFGPQNRRGNAIPLAGQSKHPMWFIAGSDYGKQVARALAKPGTQSRDYPVQGLQSYTYQEAAQLFAENYPKAQLKVTTAPISVIKMLGLIKPEFAYIAKILEALNNYPERFESTETWNDLGKPEITLEQFARTSA